ncbi:MAG: NUDIX domain-containing protein [Acetobacteraceae bacterium]
MATRSAGILMFRRTGSAIAFLLVHPGGPYWANKDDAAWSIPKGICAEGEDELAAAKREFHEETGSLVEGEFVKLGEFKQRGGKMIIAWAVEGTFDSAGLESNSFAMEWPPGSGRKQEFVEVDRAGWFEAADARRKITKGQRAILDEFLARWSTEKTPEPRVRPPE